MMDAPDKAMFAAAFASLPRMVYLILLAGIWDERILWPHANEQLARSPRQFCEHDVE